MCNKVASDMDLKDTLNLPKTNFPMRARLTEREGERIKHWEKTKLYERILEKSKGRVPFILHDGPPFTNGHVHIGTALNKILKDITLKHQCMNGRFAPFLPGWDCHGLPIEYKAASELLAQGKKANAQVLRQHCQDFSARYTQLQQRQFQRLGVLADWEAAYKTLNPAYEAGILRVLAAFAREGLLYRDRKPVYWSIPCRTALAEAEIEYHTRESQAAYVTFELVGGPAAALAALEGTEHAKQALAGIDKLSAVIWTTTAWTLVANEAVALHPQLPYVFARCGRQLYLVTQDLAKDFIKQTGLTKATILPCVFKGEALKGLRFLHPFLPKEVPLVFANYITTETGTGCVHTAPGHGQEDYQTALRYQLPLHCPVDEDGRYFQTGLLPDNLLGLGVLDKKGGSPANEAVLKLLKKTGALLCDQLYTHAYPHCWRSKTPVIFRATAQWFVALKEDGLRARALAAIDQVVWVPQVGKKRITAAVATRPDWCVSRQRVWGVPLPTVQKKGGDIELNHPDFIEKLAEELVKKKGSALWFTSEGQSELSGFIKRELGEDYDLPTTWDTLDVWMDSGCSHHAVLDARENLSCPADLYLEGSDQHRGWFQSSLLTSLALRNAPPYKRVVTHGFIVDEKGEKISKSKGALSSDRWVEEYGADLVRLWVSSQNYQSDIRLSKGHFKNVAGTYRSIRNTLMYQLGNLHDFDPQKDSVALKQLNELDQWALFKTHDFVENCLKHYEQLNFHLVYQAVEYFCGVTLSRLYHDILKDRLYTLLPDHALRRSSQTALALIFEALCKVLAPILAFTAEEAYSYFKEGRHLPENSIHLQDYARMPKDSFSSKTVEQVSTLLRLREQANTVLEKLREKKVIGRSLDAKIIFKGHKSNLDFLALDAYKHCLSEYFSVSQVIFNASHTPSPHALELPASQEGAPPLCIDARRADGERCNRSWRFCPKLLDAPPFGRVSPRDFKVLQQRGLL